MWDQIQESNLGCMGGSKCFSPYAMILLPRKRACMRAFKRFDGSWIVIIKYVLKSSTIYEFKCCFSIYCAENFPVWVIVVWLWMLFVHCHFQTSVAVKTPSNLSQPSEAGNGTEQDEEKDDTEEESEFEPTELDYDFNVNITPHCQTHHAKQHRRLVRCLFPCFIPLYYFAFLFKKKWTF